VLPKVRDYMSMPVVVVSPSDSLAHARNLMLKHKINRLVVTDDERVVGILTSTDFLKVLRYPELARKAFDELLVRDIMNEDPIVVEENVNIVDVARIMLERGISTLPVVDNSKRLVGIVTKTDLTRAYADVGGGRVKVSEVMDRSPPTVTPFHSLYRIVEAIEEKPYYKVVVVDGEVPVGVIAKRDLVFLDTSRLTRDLKFVKRDALLPKGRTGGVRLYYVPLALDIMSSPPVTTTEKVDLAEAARIMVERGIGCLPVINEEGNLVGLVTKNEVIRVLASLL